MTTYATKEFRETSIPWLPQVPEGWEVARTKQVLLANDGGVWGNDPTGENDTIVLRSTEQDVEGNLKVEHPARRNLSRVEIEKALLKENDLIITKSSGSAEHIGKTSIVDKATADMRCCFSNFLQRLRVKGSPKFFWYLYNSTVAKSQFDILCTTTTGLKNLNSQIIGNVVFVLPPLPEQRAIASYLDEKCEKIDKLIQVKEGEVGLLKEMKQGVIGEAVTRGLRGGALRASSIPWLPLVPEGWEMRRLSSIAKEKSICNSIDLPLLSVFLYDGVVPFESKAEKRTNTTSKDLSKYQRVDPGDFVLNNQQAWRGSVGVSEYLGIVSPAYFVLALNDELVPRFANYLLRARCMVDQYLVCSKGVGSIQRTLAWVDLKNVLVPVPPVEEQEEIVGYLDQKCGELDEAVGVLEKQVECLKELKQSMIADFVTGKRRIRL